ncbi:MAG: glycosyltransferase [Campylobacterota bacterium]
MKIIASVVLYNPKNDVLDNIKTYADFVDGLIVVDNSECQNLVLLSKLRECYQNNLFYVNNGNNLGIASALNIACDKAISLGFDWILTMDQDSAFINFEHYKRCLQSVGNNQGIALVSGNPMRNVFGKHYKSNSIDYEEKSIVITSSNLINLKYFNQIGRFDDSLFIDMVDYDLCARIKIQNLKILYFKDVLVEHALGHKFLRVNLLSRKKKYKIEHNAQRVYYITRNSLFVSKKYRKVLPQEFGLLKTLNILFIHDVVKILLYEDKKIDKLYAKCLGLYHFVIGRYGKYDI